MLSMITQKVICFDYNVNKLVKIILMWFNW